MRTTSDLGRPGWLFEVLMNKSSSPVTFDIADSLGLRRVRGNRLYRVVGSEGNEAEIFIGELPMPYEHFLRVHRDYVLSGRNDDAVAFAARWQEEIDFLSDVFEGPFGGRPGTSRFASPNDPF